MDYEVYNCLTLYQSIITSVYTIYIFQLQFMDMATLIFYPRTLPCPTGMIARGDGPLGSVLHSATAAIIAQHTNADWLGCAAGLRGWLRDFTQPISACTPSDDRNSRRMQNGPLTGKEAIYGPVKALESGRVFEGGGLQWPSKRPGKGLRTPSPGAHFFFRRF